MKQLLVATTVALATATSALASGPGIPAEPYVAPMPPIPASYNWTGGYVGLRLGAPVGDNFWAERSVGAESDADNWSGTPYGVTAGYDMQNGDWVFGGALDYSRGDISASSLTSATFGCIASCDTVIEDTLALRIRAGRAFDRTLIFATAGVAAGNVIARTPGGLPLGEDRLTGWTAGVGVEHAVTNQFSISIEYLHTNLGRLEIPLSCGTDCYTDVRFGTVRLGANFRF